ncbi:ubiquitin carboxyl-terminal hydrolase 27 isoform X2 [Lotus japonicus]|uniref:ubiquitin carboxyl-terminal hydrolase 27 isoform X2 n=1 Tax=Lotus japonicus TaxID=34305 RepID=UPI00258B146E|nr:ubiquitin carboxyl-terminal hydrolase 27 isoform X2 [Lotus japonicus]
MGFLAHTGMNHTQVAVGSIVGSIVGAIAIFALKETKAKTLLWSSGTRRSNSSNLDNKKPLLVPGLHNLRNNCFLNVVLQALASCFCFHGFLHRVIAECGTQDMVESETDQSMPLAASLVALLQELSSVSGEKVILSPREIMLAMSLYNPDFNLTDQQDAAEAFLHLLCSLREEFGGCYAPNVSSLADVCASNNRIIAPIQRDWKSEQERWKQLFLGPFDGILGSSLTCRSCSSQISMNFEHFDCLPLSPVLSDSFTIRVGCTLVDCLKQFIVAEHVENYHCSHCWHNAAIKYISLMEENEVELERLRRCSEQELCNCRTKFNLEKLPWSTRFSHVLKQLSIAQCPRILCIQLKRVHMSIFGEPVKLQGHISFPLILDVLPFTTTRLGVNIQEVDIRSLPLHLQNSRRNPLTNHYNQHSEVGTLKFSGINGEVREKINAGGLIDDGFASCTNRQASNDPIYPCSSSSVSIHTDTQTQSIDKVDGSYNLVSQEACLYQLVSVVEHFGRAGGGHYTVYRCARAETSDVSGDRCFNQTPRRWFCVSDSQVDAVSEEDVLSSEASLLFYERIPKNCI